MTPFVLLLAPGDWLLFGSGYLAHDGHHIVFRVVEERHPQIVGLHLGDEVRRVVKPDAAPGERTVRRLDVRHTEVQNGVSMRLAFRTAQHKPDAAAVEERQPGWRGKQV